MVGSGFPGMNLLKKRLESLQNQSLIVEGIDVKTAPTRLGHADPRTTLAVYAPAAASVDRAAADVIAERFFREQAKRDAGTKSPRHFRANPSEGRVLQNPEP